MRGRGGGHGGRVRCGDRVGDMGAPPLKPRWPCLHLDLGSLASQPREIEFLLFQAQGVGFAEDRALRQAGVPSVSGCKAAPSES